MARLVKLGLWGGEGGNPQDIDGSPTRLSKIIIRSGEAVDSLYFEYVQDGKTYEAGPWGGPGGNPNEIIFEPGEYLTAINGTTGPFSNVVNLVRSLTFVNNLRKYGPFGPEQGTPFSVPIANGRIVGFYGRSSTLLDAIGILLMPN